ncbi:hypothetical protein, partial [Winogradskyella sp.]
KNLNITLQIHQSLRFFQNDSGVLSSRAQRRISISRYRFFSHCGSFRMTEQYAIQSTLRQFECFIRSMRIKCIENQ